MDGGLGGQLVHYRSACRKCVAYTIQDETLLRQSGIVLAMVLLLFITDTGAEGLVAVRDRGACLLLLTH